MSELVGMSPAENPVANGFLLEKGIWKFPKQIYGIFPPLPADTYT